ncbi:MULTISPECIES: helix-turn-helix domain-containing protein [Cellulophaga]|uniref:Transcriptional regulator, AraC family n=2 Tax=Cellulophaga TaxID=104264 RepID=F0RGE3_CELLC|nr:MULTISPECIES: helix-turn-helix domain-containing protein [Cellulophaga]ADY30134.1 transcriptional regulator, AraC family [Cellulophaga lytica DSM 7489]EWH13750.1 AraC family transcriptional regulator [Cellulophaga geojensis KL-A]TVZ10536.1 helix-turn-helix protein [Cellulophaga sp. RHA_52]WQG75704.1 helix-turn-helix domain-containing protein [Cellulophaga lytica]SNQ43298.1 Transcriptional regulator, AraC family [Cellulophaga lytica]
MSNSPKITVVDLETYKTNPKLHNNKKYYKICLIHPKSILHYPSKSITINNTVLVFTNPLLVYNWEPISREQVGYSCLFNPSFLAENTNELEKQCPLFKLGANNIFHLNKEQETHITSLYKKIKEELDSDYKNKDAVVSNYISLIIHEALKIEPNAANKTPKCAASRITSLFFEQLNRQFPIKDPNKSITLKTPKDYSDFLSVHINHLNDSVKTITGKSTSTHIKEKITAEAENMLHNTDLNITEIAYCLGFKYPNNFSKFFKSNTGKSPLEHRSVFL